MSLLSSQKSAPRHLRHRCTPQLFDQSQVTWLCRHLGEFCFAYKIEQCNRFYPMITRYFIETFGWEQGRTAGNSSEQHVSAPPAHMLSFSWTNGGASDLPSGTGVPHSKMRTRTYTTHSNRWPDGTDAWKRQVCDSTLATTDRLAQRPSQHVSESSQGRGSWGKREHRKKTAGWRRMNADTCVSTICTRGQVWVKSRSSFTAAQTVHILPPTQRVRIPPTQTPDNWQATIVAPFKSANTYSVHVRQAPLAGLKCIICGGVKSHPVANKCEHSYCYVCIRLHLEVDWTCPHLNCNRTIRKAPKIDNAEAETVAADYPDRVDKSQVSYSWEGLSFSLLRQVNLDLAVNAFVSRTATLCQLLLVYSSIRCVMATKPPNKDKGGGGRRERPPRPNYARPPAAFCAGGISLSNGRSVTAPAHTLQMHPNVPLYFEEDFQTNAAVESRYGRSPGAGLGWYHLEIQEEGVPELGLSDANVGGTPGQIPG
ncbi:hypothetical protein B0H14DRAFT_2648972 [Mycena olivaceomarginata]|nr:hypothetical protein B0H14DRAFT_2648972 [Mycena olivaceomarginata]